MFELTETIDIPELEGGEDTQVLSETIKGGFPRIKICDKEFIKKINERKPREFSNKDILKIKDILDKKKNTPEINPLFNIFVDSPDDVVISGGENNNKQINGISIDTIIGLKAKK